jgi:hypothetical protein
MGFEHINFNGVIVFPFQHYADQLLISRRGGRARSARIRLAHRSSATVKIC